MEKVLRPFRSFAASHEGQIFFDIVRMRNSFFFGTIWSCYVLLSYVDMTFRNVVPGALWLVSVGLPLLVSNLLPVDPFFLGSTSVNAKMFAVTMVVPVILFLIASCLLHLVLFVFALISDFLHREQIGLLVAERAFI
jgi:hypothetical protein